MRGVIVGKLIVAGFPKILFYKILGFRVHSAHGLENRWWD